MKLKSICSMLLLSLFSTPLIAEKGTSLKDFIKAYINVDHTITAAKLNKQISMNQATKVEDVYKTGLSVSPYIQQSTYSLTGSSSSSEAKAFGASLSANQSLPMGFEVQAKYDQSKALNDNAFETDRRNVSLGLTQNLSKNRFGILDDLLAQQSYHNLQASNHNYNNQLITSCVTAAQLFINAYIAQSRLNILKQIADDSQKIFRISESDYQKKLMSKIDFLSAKVDKLGTEKLVHDGRVALTAAKDVITARLGGTVKFPFAEPNALSDVSVSFPLQPSQMPKVKALQSQVEAANTNLSIINQSTKTDFWVNLEVGQSYTEQAASSDIDQQYIKLGVSVDLPIYNPGNRSDWVNASLQHRLRLNDVVQETVNAKIAHRKALREMNSRKALLSLTNKRIKIHGEQIKEAYKQLRASRIELEDYIRIRDRVLNEKLEYWQSKSSIWQLSLDLMKLSSDVPAICKG